MNAPSTPPPTVTPAVTANGDRPVSASGEIGARLAPSGAAPAGNVPRLYLEALSAALERARTRNAASLDEAARVVERAVAADAVVYVFGSGHSQLAALELNGRAGGLAPLQVVFDPSWGRAELVDGYGASLVADVSFEPSDCLIAISHSGATAAAIEIARAARDGGAPVIAVTSVEATRSRAAHPAPRNRLADLADVVLDDGSAGADPGITLQGLAGSLGPTSTLVAGALLHEVVVGAVAGLIERGVDAPLFRANAEPGGAEHNRRLRARYGRRLRHVP